MRGDDALVYDTLCALQAPTALNRVSEMMIAAALRTQRGTAFNAAEVRLVVDRLRAAGHIVRDAQGRISAAHPHGAARFREMMLDPTRAKAWFEAWRVMTRFDQAYALVDFREEEQLAAAMRLVMFGGGSVRQFQRIGQMGYQFSYLWPGALHEAVLRPFDGALFARIEPALQTHLVESVMIVVSGFAESDVKPLEDWLLARCESEPNSVSTFLRGRLAETLIFRGDIAGARALCGDHLGAQADLVRAALVIAEGEWERGATQFEAALKVAAAEWGRRKNLASPSLAWLYAMALLAQPDPAAWTKARKFAAAEIGKGASDLSGFWSVWVNAIDQRLGDAPKAHAQFLLARHEHIGMQSMEYLHHLLLAAWLRIEPRSPANLRVHVQTLSRDFEQAELAWLARLTRRAAAAMLGEEPSAADAAAPFFIGAAQDRWREALAAILALGGGTANPARAATKSEADRLIWVVGTSADARIDSIEPMEQKSGVRGLGKPKPVSLP
ncbi:MAG: hypothetical protein ACKVQT_21190, partial [Burkholderiales bacterium]